MSTKIFNAYRYTGDSINTLLEDLRQCKEWYSQKVLDMLLDLFKGNEVSSASLFDITEQMLSGKIKMVLNPEDAVMVYPHQDDLYVQFFCKEGYIPEMVELSGRFEDCHYQNQTDKPEDVTEEQWECRSEIWDAIHKDYYSVENGFCYDLIKPYWSTEIACQLFRQGDVKVAGMDRQGASEEA